LISAQIDEYFVALGEVKTLCLVLWSGVIRICGSKIGSHLTTLKSYYHSINNLQLFKSHVFHYYLKYNGFFPIQHLFAVFHGLDSKPLSL